MIGIPITATLPRLAEPTKLLQVFNCGQMCGWLGAEQEGRNTRYWFHYASTRLHQPWVSLLMPPRRNFYTANALFPVFAQHLPQGTLLELLQAQYLGYSLTPLDLLSIVGPHSLGGLGFANPDQPVVKPRLTYTPESLQTFAFEQLIGQYLPHGLGVSGKTPRLLIQTQRQFNTPDSIVYQNLPKSLIAHLKAIKQQVDPTNKLYALRWLQSVKQCEHLAHHCRPDFNPHTQQRSGFEHFTAISHTPQASYAQLQQTPVLLNQYVHEALRTYCKYATLEFKLWSAIQAEMPAQTVEPFWVYQQQHAKSLEKPLVLGFDLLPA